MSNTFHSRKPNRCQSWNYSSNGCYFLTLCIKNKQCLLSKVIVGDGVLDVPAIELTKYGKICQNCIEKMNSFYTDIQTVKYIIMPNHLHLMVEINSEQGTSRTPSPTNEKIPSYISTLKRRTNKGFGENIWERSYYDHIVRSDEEYSEIWQYIDSNAAKWTEDKFFVKEVKP